MQLTVENLDIMLIISTILAASIDYYRFDRNLEFTYSDKVVLGHALGFLIWQLLHYALANISADEDDDVNSEASAKFCVACKGVLTVLVYFYHHNFWIKDHRVSAELVRERFEYTMTAQYFAVYLFLFLSVLSVFATLFEEVETSSELEDDQLIVLGMTYKNWRWLISWINFPSNIPLLSVVLFDIYICINDPTTEKSGRDIIVAFHLGLFVFYQFCRSSILALNRHNDVANIICWARFELLQLIASLVYLLYPFFMELRSQHNGFIADFKYTSMYQTVALPLFLFLMILKIYLNYKMSQITTCRRDQKSLVRYQKTVRWSGLTYETWCNFLIFLQVCSILAVPITWIQEKYRTDGFFSISEFWRIDQTDDELLVVMHLTFDVYFQILQTSTFYVFAYEQFERSFMIYLEASALCIHLALWFNPFAPLSREVYRLLSVSFPDTSIAMTGPVILFPLVQLWIIVLLARVEEADLEKANEYEILDGEANSSTKKEHHEHPLFWLRKRESDE